MRNWRIIVVMLSLALVGSSNPIISTVTASKNKQEKSESLQEEWKEDTLLASPEKLLMKKLPVKVKGIYVTGRTAGNAKFQKLLTLVDETELNAMVIDMKEDEGRITYHSTVPLVSSLQADKKKFIPDIDLLVQKMRSHHIYPIARIVCFKDPLLAGQKVNWSMKKKDGTIWKDTQGVSWIDPYRKEVWDYNIQLAKEAAKKGFKEIQFDYVRFPASGKKVDQEVAFYQQGNKKKQQVIADFLSYARKELDPYHVYISADVFGLVPSVQDDMGIGQKWELVSPKVDYISPMMYPSHYGNGTYGIAVPDANPYQTIYAGLKDAKVKNEAIHQQQLSAAIIRPWYQDFTARWVKGHITYGPKQVQEQIRAGKKLLVEQYLIWDAANTYSEAAWSKHK